MDQLEQNLIRLKKALALDLFPKEEMGNPNTHKNDLDAFFKGLGAEIHPLDMLQKAVQNDIIHSFKTTSTNEIYEKMEKGICEICDEHLDSKHECSHKGYSLLILHQDMENELMAFVFHKERKEDIQEEVVRVDDMERKVRELVKCEGQRTDQQSKNQEEEPRSVEKIKGSLSKSDKSTVEQDKEKGQKKKKQRAEDISGEKR